MLLLTVAGETSYVRWVLALAPDLAMAMAVTVTLSRFFRCFSVLLIRQLLIPDSSSLALQCAAGA